MKRAALTIDFVALVARSTVAVAIPAEAAQPANDTTVDLGWDITLRVLMRPRMGRIGRRRLDLQRDAPPH